MQNSLKKYLLLSLSITLLVVGSFFYIQKLDKQPKIAQKEKAQKATALNYEGAMVVKELTDIDDIMAEIEANPPAGGETFDLATMARAITAEALKAFSDSDEHALPLLSHWNVGESEGMDPMYMMSRIEQGEHILVSWKLDPYYSDSIGSSYYEESVKKAASLNLPLVFVLPAPESALTKDDYYRNLEKAENPNVVNTSGTILEKLSPFAPDALWNEVGEQWGSTYLMSQIQEWYPNPPLVVFVSEDEAPKLSWSDLTSSSRYISNYPSNSDDNYKRTLVGAKWIEKYRQMKEGFKKGFNKTAWKNNVKFVSYNSFSDDLGQSSAWMDDATLTSQYMNVWPLTADGATLDFDLSGTKSDTTANAPHITANNLPFMINEAKSQSPSFAYQLNLDDNSKVDDATQYRGLSQFALWFLRPSTIRQASAESTTESQEPLFKELADSVELIHYNTELAEFWRSGELVGSGESDLNANIPEQYKNDPRWFLLDTDANPPRPWAEDAEIAVWAFALVKGEAPNREWLVYVQSPSGDKSDVTVTIPEYKDVLVDSRVEGNFFILSENSEDKIDITNTTISETKEFLPIFPNAEGPGTTTPGGRNGRIIEVTSLYHSGSGSLREAVETKGPRIIIFKVSGIIDLEDKPIIVKEPYLTIAGQTAPEGGITLKGHQISIQTHDVVIRYIKSRPGSSTMETDAINIGTGAHNVVIDHCSLSWSMDEAGDVWSGISDPIHDVTWSWNLYGEGLGNHSCAQLTGSNSDVENMTDIVFHHNVFINFRHRMPLIKVKSSKLINNIMYNWGWWGTAISGGVIVDIIGNKYHTGENLESDWHPRAIVIRTDKTIADEGLTGDPDRGPSGKPSIYIAKNHGLLKYGSGDWRQTVNNNIDNWDMLVEYSYEKGWPLIDRIYQRNIPMNTYKNPITVHDAAKLDEILLKEVGASKRLNEKGEWITSRDTIDTRIIDDYKNRTGKRINHQDEVGGYISVNNGNGYLDTDHDGMPDVWENIYSLNPLSSVDQNSDNDNDGYTNIEEFLNGTHPNL